MGCSRVVYRWWGIEIGAIGGVANELAEWGAKIQGLEDRICITRRRASGKRTRPDSGRILTRYFQTSKGKAASAGVAQRRGSRTRRGDRVAYILEAIALCVWMGYWLS